MTSFNMIIVYPIKTTYRTYTEQKAQTLRNKLQKQTGVKWDYYHTGDGFQFTAIVTKDTPMDETSAEYLLPHLTAEYRSLVDIANTTGLDLATVVIGAKTLAQTQRAVPTVNRMGNFAAIRKA